MNIRLLQLFKAVCEEGNITKAAAKCYMTQPALSHAIHDLEEDLQVQLFDRYGKRIYLNDSGRLFLAKVNHVLSAYDDLSNYIPSLEEERTIRIGSSITIANDHLPYALKRFQAQHPTTKVTVFVESALHIQQRLANHEIDLALIEGVVNNPDLKQMHFSTYELLIICSKEHPLSSKTHITWNDIKQEHWLLREKGSAARDTFDSVCRLHQILIEPQWTSVNSQALIQAVRANLGLTILPASIVKASLFQEDLHILRLKDEHLQNENHIVYQKGLYESKPILDIIAILQQIDCK